MRAYVAEPDYRCGCCRRRWVGLSTAEACCRCEVCKRESTDAEKWRSPMTCPACFAAQEEREVEWVPADRCEAFAATNVEKEVTIYLDLDEAWQAAVDEWVFKHNPAEVPADLIVALYEAESLSLQLDAEDLLESALEEFHDAAIENVDVEELQRVLNKWSAENQPGSFILTQRRTLRNQDADRVLEGMTLGLRALHKPPPMTDWQRECAEKAGHYAAVAMSWREYRAEEPGYAFNPLLDHWSALALHEHNFWWKCAFERDPNPPLEEDA